MKTGMGNGDRIACVRACIGSTTEHRQEGPGPGAVRGALVHPANERRGREPPLSDALLRALRRGVVHVVHRAVPRIPRARLVLVRLVRLPRRLLLAALVEEQVVGVERACRSTR